MERVFGAPKALDLRPQLLYCLAQLDRWLQLSQGIRGLGSFESHVGEHPQDGTCCSKVLQYPAWAPALRRPSYTDVEWLLPLV